MLRIGNPQIGRQCGLKIKKCWGMCHTLMCSNGVGVTPGLENTGILRSRIPGSQGVLEAASKKKEEKQGKKKKNLRSQAAKNILGPWVTHAVNYGGIKLNKCSISTSSIIITNLNTNFCTAQCARCMNGYVTCIIMTKYILIQINYANHNLLFNWR